MREIEDIGAVITGCCSTRSGEPGKLFIYFFSRMGEGVEYLVTFERTKPLVHRIGSRRPRAITCAQKIVPIPP